MVPWRRRRWHVSWRRHVGVGLGWVDVRCWCSVLDGSVVTTLGGSSKAEGDRITMKIGRWEHQLLKLVWRSEGIPVEIDEIYI